METRLDFIPVLFVVALVGCGEKAPKQSELSNTTHSTTSAQTYERPSIRRPQTMLPNLDAIYISNSDLTTEALKQLGLPNCQIKDPSEMPVGLNGIRRSVVTDNKFGRKVGLFIAGSFESAIQEIPFDATWVHIGVEQDARPKSAVSRGTTGPLREFEDIVTEVKERIRKHSPYQKVRQLKDSFDIPEGARNKWHKEEFRYSNVRYDVIETDSLKSPYKGTIKISLENRRYLKHDEDGSTSYAGLFDTPEEAIANPNYYTGKYSTTRTRSYFFWWQNGRWVPDAGYSFPITSKDL